MFKIMLKPNFYVCLFIVTIAVTFWCIFYFSHEDYVSFPPLSFHPLSGRALIEGSFELNVQKPLNPTTLVRYAIPLNKENGLPLSSASTVVFYAPCNGEAAHIRRELVSWHRDFATKHGFSVFSLSIEANTAITNDHSQYYIYPESGWATLIFRIHEHLTREFGLELRRLIIIGESSGGSMAQQMANAYPEKISVAAWNGGSRYTAFSNTSDIRMLALNIWGCPGLERTVSMVHEGIEKGIDIRHVVTPPAWNKSGQFDQHAAWDLSKQLITAFVLKSLDFNHLVMSLPPTDFTNKSVITFKAPQNANRHVVFIGNHRDNSNLFLKNLMWDAVHRQMAASTVYSACTSEETVSNIRSFLTSNPYPDLPVVIFTSEEFKKLPPGIQVKVMHEQSEWTQALHGLTDGVSSDMPQE